MNMVRMRVGVDSRIEAVCARIDHLGAEIRARIDHNRCALAVNVKPLNQKRCTTTPVLWVLGIATAPIAIDTWDAGRRAAPQKRKAQAVSGKIHAHFSSEGRGILENSLNTLSLVIRATSSLLTPIVSANTAAVC